MCVTIVHKAVIIDSNKDLPSMSYLLQVSFDNNVFKGTPHLHMVEHFLGEFVGLRYPVGGSHSSTFSMQPRIHDVLEMC